MKLEKKHLIPFFSALKETDGTLSLKEARIRDQMLKPLLEVAQTYEQDRTKIYQKFGTHNPENNTYTFPNEKLEEVNAELKTLNEEEVELPEVTGIKEILEKTEYKPKIGEAESIDAVLELIK